MITLCPGSKQCQWWHTFPSRCIASTFPSSVSPSLARAEKRRNILVLFLPFSPLLSVFLCLTASESLLPSRGLKQLPWELSLVCPPGWEVPFRVCTPLGGLLVFSVDLLLSVLAAAAASFFNEHTTVIQGTLGRNIAVFKPLYAILAKGTLHFKIHIQIDFIILTSPSTVRNSMSFTVLCHISSLSPMYVVPFLHDVATGSFLPQIPSAQGTCCVGYWVKFSDTIHAARIFFLIFFLQGLTSSHDPRAEGRPLFSLADLLVASNLPCYCLFISQKTLGIFILSCPSSTFPKVHKEKHPLKWKVWFQNKGSFFFESNLLDIP